MDVHVGSAVISLAGRDKGRYLAVTELTDDGYVYIADGKLRRIENPKKKKIKHLSVTATVFERDVLTENKKLHKAIMERFDAEHR